MNENLRVVYERGEKLRCVFNAIVIRNRSLGEKYPGGLSGYLQKHGGCCNRMITVDSFMGGDIDEVFLDLKEHGLEPGADFVFVDAGGFALAQAMFGQATLRPKPVDLGVDWLEGWVHPRGVFVRYVERPSPVRRFPDPSGKG